MVKIKKLALYNYITLSSYFGENSAPLITLILLTRQKIVFKNVLPFVGSTIRSFVKVSRFFFAVGNTI